MGDGYNFEVLKAAILKLSKATDWEVAKKEWALHDIWESDEPDTCVCGHFPIIEICEIYNRITHQHAEVGNRCVKRFLGYRSDLIFSAIKKIRKDKSKSLNADAIAFFKSKNFWTDREYDFLQNTMNKRNLSDAQLKWRADINERVLAAISKRGFQGLN